MFKVSDLFSSSSTPQPRDAWQGIVSQYDVDEKQYLQQLIDATKPTPAELEKVTHRAHELIAKVREQDDAIHMVDALLQEYSLDTQEGILLMCLAEALMRIPDVKTADALIKDRLSVADWKKHMGQSESSLVNASTWGLLLTGKVIRMDRRLDGSPANVLQRLVNKCGEPVIRKAIHQAMKIMGRQFVLGRTISEALENAQKYRKQGYHYSFDMLGEAALTQKDAERYLQDYEKAITTVGEDASPRQHTDPSTVSIKLSALHPRYEALHEERVLSELGDTLIALVAKARAADVPLTIDAEEMDRLEISLKLFERVYRHTNTRGWGKFGLVVQAYSKRALPVLQWLTALAEEQGDLIPVRLVKGAYWDSEIKLCQQKGLPAYPVYTRKEATDVSYLACMRYLFSATTVGKIYPQFATHNAHTVAAVLSESERHHRPFEFQRLHGMGDALYKVVLENYKIPVRIYAPVGAHKDLLPYLVRRLLENGANSSFVHRLVDADTPIESLVKHPTIELQNYSSLPNSRIPLPENILPGRKNSRGLNIFITAQQQTLLDERKPWLDCQWNANGQQAHNPATAASPQPPKGKAQTPTDSLGTTENPSQDGTQEPITAPYDHHQVVGHVTWSTQPQLKKAVDKAASAFPGWNETAVEVRAKCLERYADLLESHRGELLALCAREAGKTMQDSIDEIREAVDFARFYAQEARAQMGEPHVLPGPTGESNELYLEGKGVFVCISPWNFPLAIFSGQVLAALVSGNTVIAKPAEQTTLIASRAVDLLHEAGVPTDVLQMLTGDGAKLGPDLLSDHRISGVAFTGSTQAALSINRTLAARSGAIGTLIAETGGQNAMIVDSTALPEQVIKDVLLSSFASAGQRCSALRVLFVQDDIADHLLELLAGAMQQLKVGNPITLDTDVGPVIDAEAQSGLLAHIAEMQKSAPWFFQTPLPAETSEGYFVPPTAMVIERIEDLKKEHFGPVLHIIRYQAADLDKVIDSINQTGFGLTLGIHSRNETTSRYIESRVKVGNTYINRNQIGAVVGVQPFGGHGLSGTGPKAGGPHYLFRFVNERTRTINTTAVGGNATLLSLTEEHLTPQ